MEEVSRDIVEVKVLWNNYGVEEATWENEELMKDKYLQLLT